MNNNKKAFWMSLRSVAAFVGGGAIAAPYDTSLPIITIASFLFGEKMARILVPYSEEYSDRLTDSHRFCAALVTAFALNAVGQVSFHVSSGYYQQPISNNALQPR